MKRILLISLALAVLLGVACNETTEPEGPGVYGATPAECIGNVELSFNDRDISIFEIQLASDFTFSFNPNDVGEEVNGYIIPETWDYNHIKRAVSNLFRPSAEGGAYDISLQLPENDVGEPPEGATEYTAPDIQLSLLVMFDANSGLIANKGTLTFSFMNIPAGETDQWFITGLEDYTYASKGVESASLGEILANFYAANPLEPTR